MRDFITKCGEQFNHSDIKPGNLMCNTESVPTRFYVIDLDEDSFTPGYSIFMPYLYVDFGVDVPDFICDAMPFGETDDFAIFASILTACQMQKKMTDEVNTKIWSNVEKKDGGIGIKWSRSDTVSDTVSETDSDTSSDIGSDTSSDTGGDTGGDTLSETASENTIYGGGQRSGGGMLAIFVLSAVSIGAAFIPRYNLKI
jgi:hypothetical protein